MEKLIVCTVGGKDNYYGTQMEYDAVRLKKYDLVWYKCVFPNGMIREGVGEFLGSSITAGELSFTVITTNYSRISIFTGCGDTIEKV